MGKYFLGVFVGVIVALTISGKFHLDEMQRVDDEYAANLQAIDDAAAEQFCYESYGTAVQPERMSTKAIVAVQWFHDGARGGDAFAQWVVGDDGTADCTLWIHMPKQILGDPDMDGIGHEFLHCVAGDFHPEDD